MRRKRKVGGAWKVTRRKGQAKCEGKVKMEKRNEAAAAAAATTLNVSNIFFLLFCLARRRKVFKAFATLRENWIKTVVAFQQRAVVCLLLPAASLSFIHPPIRPSIHPCVLASVRPSIRLSVLWKSWYSFFARPFDECVIDTETSQRHPPIHCWPQGGKKQPQQEEEGWMGGGMRDKTCHSTCLAWRGKCYACHSMLSSSSKEFALRVCCSLKHLTSPFI